MDAPVSATFYAVGSDRPTIRAYPSSWLETWPTLSAALANHYAADAERFHTAEACWNGDREYAEIVTLDGEIVGALDRPLSSADVAAISGVEWMEKRAFINRIRSLFNIDGYTLPQLTREQQLAFLSDPVRYFLNADAAQSDAIMREVESRQKSEKVSAANSDFWRAEAAAEKPPTAKVPRVKKAKPRVEGQRELLLPISGKKVEEKKPVQLATPRREAG